MQAILPPFGALPLCLRAGGVSMFLFLLQTGDIMLLPTSGQGTGENQGVC